MRQKAKQPGIESRRSTPVPAAAPRVHATWIAFALFALTIAVYSQVRTFDFINFDDPDSVTANPHVRGGLTAANLAWAFTSAESANWFPLTRLSHLLDVELFGMDAAAHHWVNVLLHALAVALLFAFLDRTTKQRWPSAWVAAIFALHPLHVESVAWVAERKDVLSAFFAMLTLCCYARYVARPSIARYLWTAIALALGLLSKPMLVTLPLVLVLLDIWPLERLKTPAWPPMRALLREKLPLFALSAAAAVVTFLAQQASGAVRNFEAFPLSQRIANALVSGVIYLVQTLWPSRLAVFYPYPHAIPVWQVALALIVLAAITGWALRTVRTRPYFTVGWLWYGIMLLPVIGLVQVGAQAHADRYMYLPMIGLTILLAWSAREVIQRIPSARPVIAALGAAACLACAVVTWRQLGYWQNSAMLFQHAIDVTDANYLAEHNLGVALAASPGGRSDAIRHYRASLAIRPEDARTHTDLGSALAQEPGHLPEAIAEFRAALAIDSNLAIPHNNLGLALAQNQQWSDAIAEYNLALALDPEFADARRNLADAHVGLGLMMARFGRLEGAVQHFEAALRTRPDDAEAHNNLGVVLSQMPARANEALAHFQAAVAADPKYADAHVNLGLALAQLPGRTADAIAQLEAAQRIQPDLEVQKEIERLKGK